MTLAQTLAEVRKRIAASEGKDMNEQNTKAALIDPVLRALGWDVGNLEEVLQEYKRKSHDKPIDYAMLLLRMPKLFVEAKALGQSLDIPKWANQIMGYAAVGGVKWVVLTNGDDYRIYNSCVAVPIEQKLFRSIRVSDENSPTEKTLALLTKDGIRENEIEVLWDAQFVDRQVRSALEQLFSPEPDPSLIRALRGRAKDVPAKEIRKSLARMHAKFDFPVEAETPTVADDKRSSAARKAWETRRATKGADHNRVMLRDVIEAGMLTAPLKLVATYKGNEFESELLPDGTVRYQEKIYKTCSAAAGVVKGMAKHGRGTLPINGWALWCYRDQTGSVVPLTEAREKFLHRKAR
jgi:hypothetical protein